MAVAEPLEGLDKGGIVSTGSGIVDTIILAVTRIMEASSSDCPVTQSAGI